MPIQHYRKFIVALIGALATAVSEGLISETWNSWLTVAVVFLTALGVYQVENAPLLEDSEEIFDDLD